jgi:hypothetical protein
MFTSTEKIQLSDIPNTPTFQFEVLTHVDAISPNQTAELVHLLSGKACMIITFVGHDLDCPVTLSVITKLNLVEKPSVT